jgi:patatin-like phospholipase/acyl hydrolase
MSTNNKTILLSLDGGVFRGIVELEIINILDAVIQRKKLEKLLGNKYTDELFKSLQRGNELPDDLIDSKEAIYKILDTRLIDYIDYVAGVSIGSIIGAAMTLCDSNGNYRYTTKELLDKADPKYFIKENPWYIWKTKFDQAFLEKGLKQIFAREDGKDATFEDIKKAKLLIPSYNIDENKQTIFTNFMTKCDCEDIELFQRYVDVLTSETKLADTVVASSSAQLAFPAKKISYTLMNGEEIKNTYEIDGGNIRNTPLFEAISTLVIGKDIELKDLVVISIGCGKADFDISDLKNGSVWSYIKNLLGFSNVNFITSTMLCQTGSVKDIAADLIFDANPNEKQFFNLNMQLEPDLYSASSELESVPLYRKAAQDAYREGSDEYSQLEALADYLISLENVT